MQRATARREAAEALGGSPVVVRAAATAIVAVGLVSLGAWLAGADGAAGVAGWRKSARVLDAPNGID